MSFNFFTMLESFSIYSVKDLFEVIFFCSITLGCMNWLLQEKIYRLHRLLSIFSFVFASALFFNYEAIITLGLISMPSLILISLILHEKVLQQKLIPTKKIDSFPIIPKIELIDYIVAGCLHARSCGKKINIVLTQQDDISMLIDTPLHINASVQESLLNILIESTYFQDTKMIVIDLARKTIDINCSLIKDKATETIQSYSEITTHTDAIFIYSTPNTLGFNVVTKNSELTHISAQKLYTFLKHHLVTSTTLFKGENNDKQYRYTNEKNYSQTSC